MSSGGLVGSDSARSLSGAGASSSSRGGLTSLGSFRRQQIQPEVEDADDLRLRELDMLGFVEGATAIGSASVASAAADSARTDKRGRSTEPVPRRGNIASVTPLAASKRSTSVTTLGELRRLRSKSPAHQHTKGRESPLGAAVPPQLERDSIGRPVVPRLGIVTGGTAEQRPKPFHASTSAASDAQDEESPAGVVENRTGSLSPVVELRVAKPWADRGGVGAAAAISPASSTSSKSSKASKASSFALGDEQNHQQGKRFMAPSRDQADTGLVLTPEALLVP